VAWVPPPPLFSPFAAAAAMQRPLSPPSPPAALRGGLLSPFAAAAQDSWTTHGSRLCEQPTGARLAACILRVGTHLGDVTACRLLHAYCCLALPLLALHLTSCRQCQSAAQALLPDLTWPGLAAAGASASTVSGWSKFTVDDGTSSAAPAGPQPSDGE
jgi:hypothetical protein